MNSLSPKSLLAQLNWRYATKKFDPTRKIAPDVWSALEKSLLLTPSSFGLQPWKFLVITDPTVKQKLVPVSWNQTQPADCSHHVVFAIRKAVGEADIDHFIDRVVEVRGVPREGLKGYRDIMAGFAATAKKEGWVREWAIRQAYIAIGNFMTSAAVLGVDTCPMEGIQPPDYDRILGLAGTEFETVVACAAGYRAADDKYASVPKVRFAASEVILHI
ncbi:MAG: NAD(P)H-dependent oxidoreductase [Chthoniobacteraceae bacterium]